MVRFIIAILLPIILSISLQAGMRFNGYGNEEVVSAHTTAFIALGLLYLVSAYINGLDGFTIFVLEFILAIICGLGTLMIYFPGPGSIVLIVVVILMGVVARITYLDWRYPSNAAPVAFEYSGGVTTVPAAGRTCRAVDADIEQIRKAAKKR